MINSYKKKFQSDVNSGARGVNGAIPGCDWPSLHTIFLLTISKYIIYVIHFRGNVEKLDVKTPHNMLMKYPK